MRKLYLVCNIEKILYFYLKYYINKYKLTILISKIIKIDII